MQIPKITQLKTFQGERCIRFNKKLSVNDGWVDTNLDSDDCDYCVLVKTHNGRKIYACWYKGENEERVELCKVK